MKQLKNQPLSFWLYAGLFLRLILMPWFAHEDFISHFTKVYYAVAFNQFYPALIGYPWYLIHVVYVKLLTLIGINFSSFFISDPQTLLPNIQATFSQPHVLRNIFILKIPSLIFDYLGLLTLLKLAKNQIQKKIIAITWLFNPYLLYALYLHGRNEAIFIYTFSLSLLALKNNRQKLTSVTLGLATAIRGFPLLLFPFFIKLTKFKKVVIQAAIFIFPLLVTYLVANLLIDPSIVPLHKPPIYSQTYLSAKLNLGYGQNLYLLPTFLTLIFLLFQNSKHQFIHQLTYAYIFLLTFLSLSFFHPQYFAWFTPFISLLFVYYPKQQKQLLLGLTLQFISWIGVMLYWGNGTSIGLVQPLGPYLFTQFGPVINYLTSVIELDYVGLSRSVLLASTIYLSWILIRHESNTN